MWYTHAQLQHELRQAACLCTCARHKRLVTLPAGCHAYHCHSTDGCMPGRLPSRLQAVQTHGRLAAAVRPGGWACTPPWNMHCVRCPVGTAALPMGLLLVHRLHGRRCGKAAKLVQHKPVTVSVLAASLQSCLSSQSSSMSLVSTQITSNYSYGRRLQKC